MGVSLLGLRAGRDRYRVLCTGPLDTKVGTDKKDDPAEVARVGFEAMMRGEGDIVSGWHNKLQSALANVMPAGMLARQHKKMAAPGTARK